MLDEVVQGVLAVLKDDAVRSAFVDVRNTVIVVSFRSSAGRWSAGTAIKQKPPAGTMC